MKKMLFVLGIILYSAVPIIAMESHSQGSPQEKSWCEINLFFDEMGGALDQWISSCKSKDQENECTSLKNYLRQNEENWKGKYMAYSACDEIHNRLRAVEKQVVGSTVFSFGLDKDENRKTKSEIKVETVDTVKLPESKLVSQDQRKSLELATVNNQNSKPSSSGRCFSKKCILLSLGSCGLAAIAAGLIYQFWYKKNRADTENNDNTDTVFA